MSDRHEEGMEVEIALCWATSTSTRPSPARPPTPPSSKT